MEVNISIARAKGGDQNQRDYKREKDVTYQLNGLRASCRGIVRCYTCTVMYRQSAPSRESAPP